VENSDAMSYRIKLTLIVGTCESESTAAPHKICLKYYQNVLLLQVENSDAMSYIIKLSLIVVTCESESTAAPHKITGIVAPYSQHQPI